METRWMCEIAAVQNKLERLEKELQSMNGSDIDIGKVSDIIKQLHSTKEVAMRNAYCSKTYRNLDKTIDTFRQEVRATVQTGIYKSMEAVHAETVNRLQLIENKEVRDENNIGFDDVIKLWLQYINEIRIANDKLEQIKTILPDSGTNKYWADKLTPNFTGAIDSHSSKINSYIHERKSIDEITRLMQRLIEQKNHISNVPESWCSNKLDFNITELIHKSKEKHETLKREEAKLVSGKKLDNIRKLLDLIDKKFNESKITIELITQLETEYLKSLDTEFSELEKIKLLDDHPQRLESYEKEKDEIRSHFDKIKRGFNFDKQKEMANLQCIETKIRGLEWKVPEQDKHETRQTKILDGLAGQDSESTLNQPLVAAAREIRNKKSQFNRLKDLTQDDISDLISFCSTLQDQLRQIGVPSRFIS